MENKTQHEEKEEVCEFCGGDGFIEEYGDGDNFEYDVIAEHPCPNGCERMATTFSSVKSDITIEDLEEAKKMLEKVPPAIIKGFVREESELDEFKKAHLAKEIGVKNVYGFPIYIDESLAENKIKLVFNNGEETIINII
jgi:hypothetical protein